MDSSQEPKPVAWRCQFADGRWHYMHGDRDPSEALSPGMAATLQRLYAAPPPPASAPSERPQANTGHGHVRPRPDGVKARCGGPALCSVCQSERAALAAAAPITNAMIDAAWKAMKVEPAVPMTTAMRERLRASIKAGIDAALAAREGR